MPAGEAQTGQADLLAADVRRDVDLAGDFDVPIGERVDDNGTLVSETQKASEILDEIAGDAEFVAQARLCLT